MFLFSVLGASPFFLWSSRHTLGRIMPELLGSTPLSTVLRCFVVCITLLRVMWLLLHQLHLVLACSQVGGVSWERMILWDLWGMVYTSCFPQHSCARECLHTTEKKQNFALWNNLIFQKCTFVEVYWDTSCLRAINWAIVSFAFWFESYLRCSTECSASCLQIKSQPSSFYQKCMFTNSLLS